MTGTTNWELFKRNNQYHYAELANYLGLTIEDDFGIFSGMNKDKGIEIKAFVPSDTFGPIELLSIHLTDPVSKRTLVLQHEIESRAISKTRYNSDDCNTAGRKCVAKYEEYFNKSTSELRALIEKEHEEVRGVCDNSHDSND